MAPRMQAMPREIIHEILVKLPVKSLGRCTAVCKSWRSLVQSSAFIHTHLQSNNRNKEAQRLLLQTVDKLEKRYYSLRWDSPSFSEYSRLINPFPACNEIIGRPAATTTAFPQCPTEVRKYRYFKVVGTCNGLICLLAYDSTTFIWNPCIRKFVVVPPPCSRDVTEPVTFSFYYDSRRNDYKVLRTVASGCKHPVCEVEIWSLARGSWKSLNAAAIPTDFRANGNGRNSIFVNDALHWIQVALPTTETREYEMFTFDVLTESFGKIPLPQLDLKKRRMSFGYILKHGESIAFFDYHTSKDGNKTVEMWVMENYGVAETWTKLFCVCPRLTYLQDPLCLKTNGEVVVLYYDLDISEEFKYGSVDPKNGQWNYDLQIDSFDVRFMDYFVESLVLLDQPNVISY